MYNYIIDIDQLVYDQLSMFFAFDYSTTNQNLIKIFAKEGFELRTKTIGILMVNPANEHTRGLLGAEINELMGYPEERAQKNYFVDKTEAIYSWRIYVGQVTYTIFGVVKDR